MVKLFRVKSLLLLALLLSDAAYCVQESDLRSSGIDEELSYSDAIHLKLQGLYDLSLGQWKGEEQLEASTESSGSGKPFCVISFSKNAWYGWHDYHSRDYELRLRGTTGTDGRFELRSFRGEIPVSFSLLGKGRSVAGVSKNFPGEDSLYVQSYNNPDETCEDYAFLFTARINRHDVIEQGLPGNFEGHFEVEVEDVDSGLLLRKAFSVFVRVRKTFRISGLKDVHLDVKDMKGSWLFKDMDFCVHVLNGGYYRINVQGQNNPNGDLILKNGPHELPYRMSFQSYKNSAWYIANKSGYIGWYFPGSRSLDCYGDSNATIRVELQAKDLRQRSPGSYSDVVEVTIGAH